MKSIHAKNCLKMAGVCGIVSLGLAISLPSLAKPSNVVNMNPTPLSVDNSSSLCYIFPSNGGTFVNQVPCSFVDKQTSTDLPNPKKACNDKKAVSASHSVQKTLIQFAGYGLYDRTTDDVVCSDGEDGWATKPKITQTFNNKPATVHYRHVGTGQLVAPSLYHRLWSNYNLAVKKPAVKPNYVQCVSTKGSNVDLCLPIGSVPNL